MRKGSVLFWLASLLLRLITWIHPLSRACIPRCYEDLTPSEGKKPLLVWSHGLTGTSEEHGLFAAAMASDGNIVALVHHSDGSSSSIDVAEGKGPGGKDTQVFYQHPPPRDSYDPTWRPQQIEVRASELVDTHKLIRE